MGKPISSREIRAKFLKFFEKKEHRVVASSPLVPRLDPTLLFTNAGMNQFKAVFTGEETRDYKRAASSQKCVRAGGKHNDLENVGRTARHQTFFEMLGNFSFGDYFKKEAIQFAWEFVTKELGLSKSRLYVSVFTDDDEAFGIWKNNIGIEEKRIYRFGVKDNFWAMGETGPCGPCSEIFFDQGESVGCKKSTCAVGCDCDRYLEFWNLVFMEFDQRPGGRIKLPKPSIDTGMGLERISAIVNGVTSNYDTDLFAPILKRVGDLCGKKYSSADEETQVSMRVIADHIRAMTFLIADGVLPSNEGRGYVLRRIMRRAMRHGRKLGLHDPFLHELSGVVVESMGDFYSELRTQSSSTAKCILNEEKSFAETIDRGLGLLQDEIQKLKNTKATTLSGEIAFRLYDTYGFPQDMTADILRDYGFALDNEGFEEAFERHREKARGSWKGSTQTNLDELIRKWIGEGIKTEFLGYQAFVTEGTILKIVSKGKEVESAKAGEEVEFLADQTTFYGESGGQVGDIGGVSGENFSIEIIDTKKPANGIVLHKGIIADGTVKVGIKGIFSVNEKARAATAKNHTATHMLHATLKEVLGMHVQQKGSLVAPERLRFDFSHPNALTDDQIVQIEQKLNERIWTDLSVNKEVLPFDKAIASGAVALFDEKYGSEVRVITVGDYSKELCGGTHLDRTGEIGIFKIVKESSVAAGIRRLEAFTGHRALRYVMELDRKMREIGKALGATPEEAPGRVDALLKKQKELEKQVKSRKNEPATTAKDLQETVSDSGVHIMAGEVAELDQRALRDMADQQLAKLKTGVVAIGSKKDGKAFIVIKVSKDLTKNLDAGKLVQPAAKLLEGSGGGRPDMAQAGGSAVEKLSEALTAVVSSLR